MSVESAMLVARLVNELGEVSGRKRLQKIVHLLQATGAKEFGYRFILHYFGPYSKELANDLDFLSDVKILDEDAPVGEGSYKYAVCPEVMDEVNRMSDRDKGSGEWKELALELNGESVSVLEALSTIVFLSKQRKRQGDRLRKEFDRIKPNLVGDCFASAVQFGREHKFISESEVT